MTSRFLIGPYFFEENGVTVIINGERHSCMLSNFLIPHLKSKRKLFSTTFQQDGASAHLSSRAKEIIQAKFQNRVNSRHFNAEWPAFSLIRLH